MIRVLYIFAFLVCQLLANNKIESSVSFEYWINEDLRLFVLQDIIDIEIQDDVIEISASDWFGEILLNESLEYENQSFISNNLFTSILTFQSIPQEDEWLYDYALLDGEKIAVRYLFSKQIEGLRLYRLDIKQINKGDVDNKINNVILDSDVIMIWTDLNKSICKIEFVYKSFTYVIEKNED